VSDNLGYLFAAFTAVWLGIFLYVRRLARRGRELEEELQELRRRLER
jgi:CcmD family protein